MWNAEMRSAHQYKGSEEPKSHQNPHSHWFCGFFSYRQFDGICGGIAQASDCRHRQEGAITALTTRFVRPARSTGKTAEDKYAVGGGMYLRVKPAGKYWHMDYRVAGKRRPRTLGVCPDVSLARAREKRQRARKALADDIASVDLQRTRKAEAEAARNNTVQVVGDSSRKIRGVKPTQTRSELGEEALLAVIRQRFGLAPAPLSAKEQDT